MSNKLENKREREKKIISDMINLYCKKRHKNKNQLCKECNALCSYAKSRSDKCPYMQTKTFCSNCTTHCYNPEMRQKVKEVMRFSGPRMLLHHPFVALRHMIETIKEKKKLRVK